MTIDEKKRELALYRLRQADESLDEARYLLAGGKSGRAIINRCYYAMFYAVLALFVFEDFSSSKHSGILSHLNRSFIKTGRLPKQLGESINVAFELRQRADYREYSSLDPGQVSEFLPKAEEFTQEIDRYLTRDHLI